MLKNQNMSEQLQVCSLVAVVPCLAGIWGIYVAISHLVDTMTLTNNMCPNTWACSVRWQWHWLLHQIYILMACQQMEYCKHTQEVIISDTNHAISEVGDLLPPPLTLHWHRWDTHTNEFDTVARLLPDLKTIILHNAIITQPLKINTSVQETVFIDCTISHDVFVSLIPQNRSVVVGRVHTRFSNMGYNCMSGKSML